MKFEDIKDLMQKPEPKADTYEAGMAQNQLLKIGTHAIKIHNMLDDGQEMESWVAKKIDLASNYVKSVHGYTAGSKAGTYDDDGMSEMKRMPKGTGTMQGVKEDAGFNVDAWSTEKVKEFGPDLMLLAKGKPIEMPGYDSYGMELDDGRPDDDEGNVAADDSIGGEVTNAIRGHRDSLENSKFSMADYDRVKPNAATIKYAQNIINSPEFKKAYNSTESVSEDAGEGHMSKSQLYATAKMAIELIDMIKKGDDLEGWVQTKLNLAADYLQAVYHYEDYQKLNPYREELDSNTLHRHAGIIQKSLDGILARETEIADVDTKPGMMRILKKRVNEVEKDIAKENRKETNEDLVNEDPRAVGRALANLKYGKEMADAILKGKDTITLVPKAQSYISSVDQTIELLDKMYPTANRKESQETTESELEEGIKDWAKNLAMAGVIVAGLTGVNSINNAIDNSVPAIQAMNSALEMAQDQNDDKLAQLIKKDLSDAKLRLDTGKDLSHVKDLQDKYAKFMKTEGLAYESKLAVRLKQRLK